ncbi:unnamed protein product [Mytilus coruscus]|uniref:MULE transposase domain-containing protein n=1 Tax=Mytilus coruscus TaxID=42192 RepID=A0A6J8A6B6_MYTCO|nr:unnamed protein product [Mytilus coruscus]
MFPLVYVLLSGKDEIIYSRFFRHIRNIAELHQLQLQPETVFIDYETETNNAIGTVFPGVTVKGCFFHFTLCIWRLAKKCGLKSYYKENEDITQLIRQAAVLSLYPHYLVDDVWLTTLEDIGEADTIPATTSFTDYMTESWVEGYRFLWNHCFTEGPTSPTPWKFGTIK